MGRVPIVEFLDKAVLSDFVTSDKKWLNYFILCLGCKMCIHLACNLYQVVLSLCGLETIVGKVFP